MEHKFTMSLSLNVLNHLGINLYSNVPAVLSEIVANSWDADAENVTIAISSDEIIIEDNGCGMTVSDINSHFLKVGYQKREDETASSKFKRRFMGRKGIGKLSMFSIAREVDVISRKTVGGVIESNALRMNIDKIADSIKNENINAERDYHPDVITEGYTPLEKDGTRIVLRQLKKNISSLTPEYVRKRVARRFGIIGAEYNFSVAVNGEEVTINDRDYYHKLSYIWYYGAESQKYADYSTKATHKELRDNSITISGETYQITGWIGTVDVSGDLKDGEENLNKIVILVRGKLGQEDILSEYSEGGLYSKYIIGEINADFFDDDNADDMATSSRQEYKRDDERFLALKQFIKDELKYIQGKWTDLRNESGEEKARELLPAIDSWFKSLSADNRKYAKKMFGKINQIPADDSKKREVIKYSVLAFEKLRYANKLSAIEDINLESLESIKDVFLGLDELEATLYYQIIHERIEIIKKFQQITDDDMREKVIQEYLFNHLWLLDPAWERVDGTEYMERTVLNALNAVYDKLTPEEKNGRLDIGYRSTAGKHIVIELKKAKRVVKIGELTNQIVKYSETMQKVLTETSHAREPFEIICVLGMPVDNNDDPTHREQVNTTLKAWHARIVFYKELIENAYKAYNDYITANQQSQNLIDLMHQLEIETAED